jgi:hypothetical protein
MSRFNKENSAAKIAANKSPTASGPSFKKKKYLPF